MTALVSDFGISRLVMSIGGVANTAADVGASTANMLCGSIGYIPPGTYIRGIQWHPNHSTAPFDRS